MEDTGTSSAAVADAPASTSTSSDSSSTTVTSTPASEPQVTTDRPSIKDALTVFNEQARQQGRKPRGVVTAPEVDPAATVDPAAPAAPAQPAGPVPTPVHIKAVENARLKGRQDAEQEFRTSVGDPAVAKEAVRWFQSAANDRVGFIRGVLNEALSDPTLGPQILSLAGKTLGGNRGATTAPAATEMPQPDFQDGNGNKFYSAERQQQRDEWLASKLKGEILDQVQPDLEQVRSEREQRQAETAQRQTVAAIHGHISEAKKLPYFAQFQKEIGEAARAMPLTSGHPAEEAIVLQRAYWQVVGPQLSKLEQQRVVAELKSRANASSLNPAATGAPSGVPKNVRAKDGGTFGNALAWAQAQQSGR